MWKELIVPLLIVQANLALALTEDTTDTTCTDEFCETYLETPGYKCPELTKNCMEGKKNFNGWVTEYPGPCNCCPYCIEFLKLGDECPVGESSSVTPTHICGPGLYCLQNAASKRKQCEIMENTPCTKAQKEYEESVLAGTVGNLQVRPECDDNGNFATYKCVPGEICYCQDKEGNRIFGEIPYSPIASQLLTCGCSRLNLIAQQQSANFANTWSQMRCNADGSFDAIQCLDDEGCLCVDKQDGNPTFPDRDFVNITSINNKTMPCFDNTTHAEYDYYRICEDSFDRNYRDDREYVESGYDVYGSQYHDCQMDGYYAPIQRDSREVYCADKYGKKIGKYALPLSDEGVELMNCKCARANLIINVLEKPECCPNGNYKKMQCRRGECRCVDEDGNQVEKEVDYDLRDKLSCFNAKC